MSLYVVVLVSCVPFLLFGLCSLLCWITVVRWRGVLLVVVVCFCLFVVRRCGLVDRGCVVRCCVR